MDKEQLERLQTELLKAKDLAGVAESEGGKRLISALTADVLALSRQLGSHYKTATYMELVALCASLGEKLQLLEVLRGAPGDFEKVADDLKEAQRVAME